MHCCDDNCSRMTRRHFFGLNSTGVGIAALAALSTRRASASEPAETTQGGLPGFPNFAPRAKRVIYLFQSGGPSQMELFDYKPRLEDFQGTDLPDSIRGGQRLTGMSASQSSFPVVPSKFAFAQHGNSGAWVSELLPTHGQESPTSLPSSSPSTPKRSITIPPSPWRRPASAWAADPAWALGSPTASAAKPKICPHSCVMISTRAGANRSTIACGAAASCRAVIRASSSAPRAIRFCIFPIPPGFHAGNRRTFLDALGRIESGQHRRIRRPRNRHARIAQYEMAFRMQCFRARTHRLSKEPAAHLRALRRGREKARHLRRELPAGAPSGRARRTLHPALSPRLGPPRRICRRICRSAAKMSIRPPPR